MHAHLIAGILVCLAALPVRASEQVDALAEALALPALMEIMRTEGMRYGNDVATDFFAGTPPRGWDGVVGRIYDAGRMQTALTDALEAQLDPAQLEASLEFFATDTGQQVVALELSAREAFLDPDTELAATEAMRELDEKGDARLDWIKGFVAENDLVDENVVGALNANLAFLDGLATASEIFGLTQEQMLQDVWAQEAEIRASTEDWLYAFLLMAYSPLEDAELEDYGAFTRSDAGTALFRALFDGFDIMFVDISRDLGMAVARYVGSEEL